MCGAEVQELLFCCWKLAGSEHAVVAMTKSPSCPTHANKALPALLKDAKHCFFYRGSPLVPSTQPLVLLHSSRTPLTVTLSSLTLLLFPAAAQFCELIPHLYCPEHPHRTPLSSAARPLLQPGCALLVNSGLSGRGWDLLSQGEAPAFLPHVQPPLKNMMWQSYLSRRFNQTLN